LSKGSVAGHSTGADLRLCSRGHATSAQLGLRASQWLTAALAWRPIEREPMVHHRIRIGFRHTSHLFITVEQRLKSHLSFHAFERYTPPLTKFLCCTHTLAVEPIYFEVFDFVQHGHFGFTAPTPEPLHLATIIADLYWAPCLSPSGKLARIPPNLRIAGTLRIRHGPIKFSGPNVLPSRFS